jgi:signal transduction histidine kinase
LLSEVHLNGFGDDRQAETYAIQGLQIADSLGYATEKSKSLSILASIFLKRSDWEKTKQYALQSLDSDSTEVANTMLNYEYLSKAYAHLGNAAKAGEYFDKHNALQASWSNKHYQSAIREMETKYETEKKETQIATLEDEKRLMIWLGIAGGAVLLLALAAFFFLWRWTVQKKRLAESQIKQLEQEKQLIATQAVLDGEVQERIRLARDLHDGLGSMLASVKVNLQNTKREITGESKHYSLTIDLLDDSMKELRRIAHHLMPELLMRCGLKTSLETFCQSMPDTQFHYFGEDARFDGKLETLLYRSAHELIYNAIKHAEATQTNVQLIQESGRISLTVHDNGKGFDPSRETGGMGLNNIRQRVAVFKGEFSICSEPGQGTEIHMEFHLKPDSHDKGNNH